MNNSKWERIKKGKELNKDLISARNHTNNSYRTLDCNDSFQNFDFSWNLILSTIIILFLFLNLYIFPCTLFYCSIRRTAKSNLFLPSSPLVRATFFLAIFCLISNVRFVSIFFSSFRLQPTSSPQITGVSAASKNLQLHRQKLEEEFGKFRTTAEAFLKTYRDFEVM